MPNYPDQPEIDHENRIWYKVLGLLNWTQRYLGLRLGLVVSNQWAHTQDPDLEEICIHKSSAGMLAGESFPLVCIRYTGGFSPMGVSPFVE